MSGHPATELPDSAGKLEFALGGLLHEGGGVMANRTLCLYDGRGGGSFIEGASDAVLARAKRWKTRAGVERFIAAERLAGSDWTYTIVMVSPR